MSSKIGYYIIKPKSNFYLKDQKTLIFQHKKELLFLNLNAQICDVISYDGTYVRTFPSRRKGSASSYQCYPALGLQPGPLKIKKMAFRLTFHAGKSRNRTITILFLTMDFIKAKISGPGTNSKALAHTQHKRTCLLTVCQTSYMQNCHLSPQVEDVISKKSLTKGLYRPKSKL